MWRTCGCHGLSTRPGILCTPVSHIVRCCACILWMVSKRSVLSGSGVLLRSHAPVFAGSFPIVHQFAHRTPCCLHICFMVLAHREEALSCFLLIVACPVSVADAERPQPVNDLFRIFLVDVEQIQISRVVNVCPRQHCVQNLTPGLSSSSAAEEHSSSLFHPVSQSDLSLEGTSTQIGPH